MSSLTSMSGLTTNNVFELASKIASMTNLIGFSQQEKHLLEDVVEERAKKMAVARKKNLKKYLEYCMTNEKHDNKTLVSVIIEHLDPIELSHVFKKGKLEGNGELLYQEFTDVLNSVHPDSTLIDLMRKVVN